MIHFDFDDRYEDEGIVGNAISRREGFVVSVVVHGLVAALLVAAPQLDWFQPSQEEEMMELAQPQQPEEEQTFVFVQPRVDLEALQPPQTAPLSDLDRQAQAPEVALEPENPVPFSLGDSTELVEPEVPERAAGQELEEVLEFEPTEPRLESEIVSLLPTADEGLPERTELSRPLPPGVLGEALRNLERYVQRETFDNPQGGQDSPGASIQFDTKGVEFGPWLRRFVARVRRNWFIPLAARTMQGHVVLQFNIHKNGMITDVVVVQPSGVESFNIAARNAILGSNPVDPLPPEYPSDRAFFTVTFYYNQQPL